VSDSDVESSDVAPAERWFASKGWVPLEFQREVWRAYAQGESGLVHAATGTGKTLAAWWGPLLFFGAAIAVLALAVGSRRALRGSPVDAAWPRIAGDALAFVTAYAFTAFAAELPDVVLAVLVGWWIARMLSSRAQPWVVALGLGLAVLGPLFEDRWASLGMFAYCRPDLAGVPRWLPALYLHVAPLAARLEARVSA